MKKIAFYIIERPIVANNPPYGGEVKDNEDIHDNLAPIEVRKYCLLPYLFTYRSWIFYSRIGTIVRVFL